MSALAAVWTIAVAISGGFVLEWNSVRLLASRSPRNPAVAALIVWAAWWALATSAERSRWRLKLWSAVRRTLPIGLAGTLPAQLIPLLGAATAIAIVALGIVKGAPYAGGSDAYGYVSQAHLWATGGTLRVEQPFVREITWPFVAEAVTPLGYRPVDNGLAIVPVYSPGLPMLMGAFERLEGRDAVFYVVPLLGGLAVWATYLMGARLVQPAVGALAAALVATSPTFLFHLLVPMSDVPVTAWWALTLALLLYDGRAAALGAGLACGAAILTRPNLVPLAMLSGVALMWPAREGRRGPVVQRTLLFAVGVISACAVVMRINQQLWGSAFATGYEPLHILYSWDNLLPNLERYPRWLVETETPIVLLAAFAPWLVTQRRANGIATTAARAVTIVWLCFIGVVFLSYVFHHPNDGWFWLRYLLPAFPPLLVLTSVALNEMFADLERGLGVIALTLIVSVLSWHGVAYSRSTGMFTVREGERKSKAVGEHIAASLPDRAVFISKLHSGSIRYYSGRFTVRYDWIPPRALDFVVDDLLRLNYRPYIVLEASEEMDFRELFEGARTLIALDRAPMVLLDNAAKVRIYDPLNVQPGGDGGSSVVIR